MLEASKGKSTSKMDFSGGRYKSYNWFKRMQTIEDGSWTPHLGNNNELYSNLYRNMSPVYSWDPTTTVNHTGHGAVFNLDFSPDGLMLVAACEKRSILVFDSLRGKLINYVNDAHFACVNCVRFLDSRMLATCSDDNTVSIWDVRYLKYKIRCLQGHSNWVKNIEYAQDVGLLVTASFDGSIYTWDINRYSKGDIPYKRVLHTQGLMRAKLSPDFSKLVMCTSHGCIMVIHDLNLQTLGTDLRYFQPTIYRLMQTTNAPIHLASKYNHLFSAKRNRIELITDFPKSDEAGVISSLQVHPQNWSVVSRNTSNDDTSEWSCMHDLHSYPLDPEECPEECPEETELESEDSSQEDNSDDATSSESRPLVHIRLNYRPRSSSDDVNQEGGAGANFEGASSSSGGSVGMTLSVEALAAILAVANRNRLRATTGQSSSSNADDSDQNSSSESPERNSSVPNNASSEASASGEQTGNAKVDNKRRIMKNRKRMTHYIMEPNVGRGFIKELCFSTDGRLVCSPFDHGVRLLAFSPKCEELCDCVPETPTKFHVVSVSESHPKVVVCTKFSPNHSLLASGCLGGKICFHQPYF
ncbi:hypothetical protein CHUAL_007999 [Chamberlinius hualienensis]